MSSSFICPRCSQRSPVRLPRGVQCAQCRSQTAWETWGRREETLKISLADIEEAEKLHRRQRRAGRWRVLTGYALPVCALAAVGVAAERLASYNRTWPVMDPEQMVARLDGLATHATAAAAVSLVLAAAGLVCRRHRGLFHSLPMMGLSYLAMILALVGLVSALSSLGPVAHPPEWRYSTIPPLEAAEDRPGPVGRVQRATAVIMAPDEDGDFRKAAMGTGVVVARSAGKAFIVTCSHVAMQHLPPGAVRKPEDAYPLWVVMANGASGIGTVRWCAPPPIDVVLVELDNLDEVPEPAQISPSTDYLLPGTPVFAVPNPLRNGWMTYDGSVLKQESRSTPAGAYRLVFSDLPVVPGDSGSGLFDGQGRLIGVNTWMLKTPNTHQTISLPSETMRSILKATAGLKGRVDR